MSFVYIQGKLYLDILLLCTVYINLLNTAIRQVNFLKHLFFVFDLEGSLHEAGYFQAISRRLKLTVDLVQLSKRDENEGPMAPVLRAMQQIRNLETEVILLYTNTEYIELMLQQVIMYSLLI